MSTKPILRLVSATLLALLPVLQGCIVPPSMLERASWGPPPEYWQEQGRYRQAGDGIATEPEPGQLASGARPAQGVGGAENGVAGGGGVENSGETLPDPSAPAPEVPLYAWDGGVVDGAPQGRVTPEAGTPRGLEAPSAGRTHIIELYQQVLDERDALAEEVELLRKDLEQTRFALQAKSRESDELTARVAALEAAHDELRDENQSLAARLVQAQIRRLEAEKLLLETRIEQERAKAESARAAAAAVKPGAKSKPAAKNAGSESE